MTSMTNDANPSDAAATMTSAVAQNPTRRGPVLLATDGSDPTGAAVVAAQWLAKQLSVPLDVVSVLEPMYPAGGAMEMTPISGFELDIERRNTRATRVRDVVTRLTGEPPREVSVRLGSTAREIAEGARAVHATLIVMGAAPHRRLHHIVAGERAARVLRLADCPLLSVAPGFAFPLRNVVVGVDFGPASIRAVQAALLLLGESGTLTMVHVAPPWSDLPHLYGRSGRELDDAVHTMFGRLRDSVRPCVGKGVTVETRFAAGGAAGALLDTVRALRAEIIGVGTHGPGPIARLVGGSVAASILHGSEASVLAAPPPPPSEALELRLQIAGTAESTRPDAWGSALDAFSARNT